ncbi:MAG: ribonuclease PH [Alphaproteobacteria bacterium]|nr:ribonuclease PH [Alphaproteobacteria bacterium]MCB9931287.1 ribonuclease PH [Alphaproteobacteria bacterium]
MSARPSGRAADQLRPVSLEPGFSLHAEGSCLVRFGNTHVLCTASVEDRVPPFMRGQGRGWVTAEYGMLPRSTHTRTDREASRGKQSGRTQEIQRLIGRSLRSVVDLQALGERQVKIDCDVIQADGGTRTASITGAYVALYQAFSLMQSRKMIKQVPLSSEVVAVSCGVYKDQPVLDLDYAEDSSAQADSNFVMTGRGEIIEIQATGEDAPLSKDRFNALMTLAEKGCSELVRLQRKAIMGMSGLGR